MINQHMTYVVKLASDAHKASPQLPTLMTPTQHCPNQQGLLPAATHDAGHLIFTDMRASFGPLAVSLSDMARAPRETLGGPAGLDGTRGV
jgi:hypothetical protein